MFQFSGTTIFQETTVTNTNSWRSLNFLGLQLQYQESLDPSEGACTALKFTRESRFGAACECFSFQFLIPGVHAHTNSNFCMSVGLGDQQ